MLEVTPAEIALPAIKKSMAAFRTKVFNEALESWLTYAIFEPIDCRFFSETEHNISEALRKAFGIDFTGEMKVVSTVHDSIGFVKGDRLARFLEGEG